MGDSEFLREVVTGDGDDGLLDLPGVDDLVKEFGDLVVLRRYFFNLGSRGLDRGFVLGSEDDLPGSGAAESNDLDDTEAFTVELLGVLGIDVVLADPGSGAGVDEIQTSFGGFESEVLYRTGLGLYLGLRDGELDGGFLLCRRSEAFVFVLVTLLAADQSGQEKR